MWKNHYYFLLWVTTVSCQPPYYWTTTPEYNHYNPYTTPEYNNYNPYTYSYTSSPGYTEHPGGTFTDNTVVFSKNKSPYFIRNDIIVEENAEVVIQSGVELRFEPQTGITVRGILTAVGTAEETITLTTSQDVSARNIVVPDIRLVDGPSILAGRVQLRHNGAWRSVCTNSKNWTLADMETACRQLGFQGGSFFNWHNRQMPLKPRLLYEEPNCLGTESTMFDCQWHTRQMGSGVCDYHPDLAIECLPRHDESLPFWRGIRFENAKYTKTLTLQNTLYVPTSSSQLKYVIIKYAGAGRDQNATDAVHVHGIPPHIDQIDVLYSAYNGINITLPDGAFKISNCRVTGNRGYGIFINSTFGLAHVDGCTVTENGGDGIRYVQTEERPDEKFDKSDIYDFCTLATTSGQTYPIQVFAEQEIFSNRETHCTKMFKTRYDHVITLNFLRAETDRNASASIEVYDGSSVNNRHITSFKIVNNTRPQSVTTISNQIYIVFKAAPRTRTFIYMRLLSGLTRTYDLNVSRSDIAENNGRGVVVDNLKSHVHIHDTTISKNNHVAGFQVTSGVGNVNVTQSRISFNEGDGINITYTGGCRNISRSWITSNQGYGIAIWLNDTKETEYIYVNQSSVVQYSHIVKNIDIGVLHGNFCDAASVNITGNTFENSLNDALEILSCWRVSNHSLKLQIGHNNFISNERVGIKIKPALNIIGRIEFNWFKKGTHGALMIKNKLLEEFNILPLKIVVQQNYFQQNTGIFVINIGLSPYSEVQYLLFTRNFVKDNVITEPFLPEDGSTTTLNPRSRVAAPVVVGSNNVEIFRNIIDNPSSKYEIGSHLEDQSKVINCTFNWIGSSSEEAIFNRIFHRYDRYNLAKITYMPFLLHNSNPLTTRVNNYQQYVPLFNTKDTSIVGGEIEGEETITSGEYVVEKDINIRPGGKLTIEPGVTLRFPPSIGIMIGGKLEARGIEPDSIKFTLKEEITFENTTFDETENIEMDTEVIEKESNVPVRLLGGKTDTEGRLQVKINNQWGTVCNYGWNIKNAALVCHQLGLALNPNDWFLERNEIPEAGTSEKIILSNVQCEENDIDITKCRAERMTEFEYSCAHENDVGVKCYKTSWAGVRFGVLAERSNLQFITIEKAGLLDYAVNQFKPALQMDFARHNFENIRINNNFHDGLGIMYSDIFTEDSINVVKNSEFTNNRGAGVSFKQLGLKIHGSVIENNYIGIEHNPALSALQQRELAGWFTSKEPEFTYSPFWIPHSNDATEIFINQGETKYMVTSAVTGDSIARSYRIRCIPGFVIGIQLLNPIQNRSSEVIFIHDAQTYNIKSAIWNLNRDLTIFPTTASSHGIILDYTSGSYSLGGTVLVLSAIRAPIQDIFNRIVKGPVPTATITSTKIKNNVYGIHVSYYNRYLNELGDHFLRKANETLKIINSEISHNKREAMFVHSPHWDLHRSNISEITFMINNTLITDNGGGIFHFSRDMRASNNLFHYILQDDTIERNAADGFHVNLPYVWQYNENFTHSVYMNNDTWRNNRNFEIIIDGHFAIVNITGGLFTDNHCKESLLSIRGMEKKILINYNKFVNNNGKYVIDFSSDSQSEIIGEVPARFIYNELYRNRYFATLRGLGMFQLQIQPTSVVNFRGIQKVNINRNLLYENNLEYQLVAGIKTAKINNFLDVTENWWGTIVEEEIKRTIFDFDDWNNHAIARFMPYLTENSFEGSHSVTTETRREINMDTLGGRITEDLVIPQRTSPYIINQDITVMPDITLTISPGVVMEFAPNVGILVLGSLKAQGIKGWEIIMRPLQQNSNLQTGRIEKRDLRVKRELENFSMQDSIRLCKGRHCDDKEINHEGFLEYFNKTTLQWIPMCDPRFTERNAQVVCRELGFDHLSAFFDYDVRIEYHSNSLSRIWSWPEPLQCTGTEMKYEECPIRLNGQQFGHRHECKWNSKFVFVHCGRPNLRPGLQYWGGIRFADSEFEQRLYEHRIHDVNTHDTIRKEESILELVNITGAGILHNEKSPAVQTVVKSPRINYVSITRSASHGINLISPADTMNLISNKVSNSLGVGINILSIPGEGRESDESSFTPMTDLNIPYNIFSLVDVCDTTKEIRIEERVIVYYKYDNHPVNCVKIIKSSYNIKPLGFRLLQFNLFNSTNKYGIPDYIQLYDGDIYNVTSRVIKTLTMETGDEKRLVRTKLPSLSIKLFGNGASSNYGFIAEVVTLPISAIGFNRDVQHNITNSLIERNREGGLLYVSAGEVNPIVTIDRNQFKNNCQKLYGNFTTCRSCIDMDFQNTRTLYFRNNLVDSNQGGISIRADSRGSATSLKGFIHNNLFVNNSNLPTIYVEGRQSSPYQEVTIYRNYITRNVAVYHNNVILKQVVSNFTYNYIKRNTGLQNLEVSGFDKVRLPIYQSTTHNGFYENFAVRRESRSTIVAGTAGQHYVDNIFYNPNNDYEMITVNKSRFNFNSTLELWRTKIDAAYNYWGFNTTLAVSGRIRDQSDDEGLLEVEYIPYYMNNRTILDGKCPPGWSLVGDTCYMFIGAPMTFNEAREFCQADNASVPYLIGNINYYAVNEFLMKQYQWYFYADRVWVQHIDRINQCTLFVYQNIELGDCQERYPFICEIDPKVYIDPLMWHGDALTIAIICTAVFAIILLALVCACWWGKSKYRQTQRFERRNSIRQSLHSLRSVGTANGFDMSYRRKPTQLSARSTDTLTKSSDYKKMISNGSIDSMEKSTYTSTIEDNQSYDIYETHNPNTSVVQYNQDFKAEPVNQYAQPHFNLAYKNEGFKDNSTFASNSNYQSRAESVQDTNVNEETPIIHSESNPQVPSFPPSEYYTNDTLPLSSTSEKSDRSPNFYHNPNTQFLNELSSKLPRREEELPGKHYARSMSYTPDYNIVGLESPNNQYFDDRPHSDVLETDFDEPEPKPKIRSKSEALLETNFDYEPEEVVQNYPMTQSSRSKSQPLETAM